jgi:hypothetical protein
MIHNENVIQQRENVTTNIYQKQFFEKFSYCLVLALRSSISL